MVDSLKKILEPITEVQNIRGIELPIGLEFLQLVVTGPPGAGKSYYIERIGGWPNEGYLDLTQKGWWKDQSLIYRPREVHLGLPFVGFKEALTVFDPDYLGCEIPPELDLSRICIPPLRHYFFQTNWRHRYIFEFLIPSPSTIYNQRLARQSQGYFPVDENLSLEMVRSQVAVYRDVALYLHRAGLPVYLRKSLDKPPLRIAERGIGTVPRWSLTEKSVRPSLQTLNGWKYLFRKTLRPEWLTVTSSPQLLTKAGRLAHDGRSFQLTLGATELYFRPEILLGIKRGAALKNWVISTHQGCSPRSLHGFVRVKVGETIVLGSDNKDYRDLFNFDDQVASRHVSITNRRGDLIITPLIESKPTVIQRIDDLDYRERLEQGRLQALKDIRQLYGQKIEPLSPYSALQLIRRVNAIQADEKFRPPDDRGRPGGLIEIEGEIHPVVIGDLHARVDNLLKILSENCLLECLRMGHATLIFLGDATHSEITDELDQFDSSMCMMDLIFKLKIQFPENVFYLRGNHDSFSPEINKNGVLQGVFFRQALEQTRGHQYAEEMDKFYDSLAYIISTPNMLACHAGPPRTKVEREELINIHANDSLIRELTRNRLQRPNYLGGYTKRDVKKLRKSLDKSQKVRFVVGHTPMDPFNSFWLHAGSIRNHHIIYSAHTNGTCVLIRTEDSFHPITFPAEPLIGIINKLPL